MKKLSDGVMPHGDSPGYPGGLPRVITARREKTMGNPLSDAASKAADAAAKIAAKQVQGQQKVLDRGGK